MRQISAATIVLILLLAHVTSVAAPSPSKAGNKILTSLVKELVDIGDYANRNGFPVTAKAYIDEALAFAPEDKRAIRVSEKIKDGEDATTEKAISKFNRRAKKAHKKIATGYLAYFKEYISDKDRATVNGYLASAFKYDRETANEYIDREAKAAFDRKDFATTHRLLDVAAPIAGELEDKILEKRKDMMVKCVVMLSQKAGLQKTATTHKMQYLLGLPKEWSADKKWPIVFACSGAGCGWRSTYNSAKKLSDGEFIVVTPMTFSNTNAILKSKYP
ncbi:MAG: hypothetical protein L3J82_07995 [Planctomycetes bacterium]|nr:hypothetical protein [Planctomycetota bacterium]